MKYEKAWVSPLEAGSNCRLKAKAVLLFVSGNVVHGESRFVNCWVC